MGYPRMLAPDRRPYATSDGYISVIAVSDAHYRRIFTACDRPDLMDDPRYATVAARSDNVDLVLGTLSELLRGKTTAVWMEILTAADIPNGPVNSLPDLLEDAYLKETGFFQDVAHPVEGRMVLTAIPAAFSASPPNLHRLPPVFGEHTAEVLAEIGCSAAEIAEITGKVA